MFSKKIIDGTQKLGDVTQNGTQSGDAAIFWTWKIMKIDLLIKCVKELGYHLGTILGTIWVPLDILGTTGVPYIAVVLHL